MDLREQLQATYNELSAREATESPAPAPEPVEAPATDAAVPEAQGAADADRAAQPRDASGKFAPKTEDTAAPAAAGAEEQPPAAEAPKETETAQPVEKEPQTEAIPIPPSLSAAVKAQWSDLKPEVQQAFRKLEDSVQTAKAEWGRKGERLNRYDEIIGPHLDRWRFNGLDEFSGIQALIAAQNVLERNPAEGLAYIARSYGVDLRALAGQALQQRPGAEGQQAPTAAPELQAYLQPLVQQVQTLQQRLQQADQRTEAEHLASARAEVEAFATRPENKYFENVRPLVAKLIETGVATTLQEAYDLASYRDPEVRAAIEAERSQAAAADAAKRAAEQQQRQKSAAATAAAGSVVGAPAPGAQAPKGPPGSIRDTLVAAAREVGYQV